MSLLWWLCFYSAFKTRRNRSSCHTPNPFVCKFAQENSDWLHAMAAGSDMSVEPACMRLVYDLQAPVFASVGLAWNTGLDFSCVTQHWELGTVVSEIWMRTPIIHPSARLKQEDSKFKTSPCFENYIRRCANGRAIDEMAQRPLKKYVLAWAFCCFCCFRDRVSL